MDTMLPDNPKYSSVGANPDIDEDDIDINNSKDIFFKLYY